MPDGQLFAVEVQTHLVAVDSVNRIGIAGPVRKRALNMQYFRKTGYLSPAQFSP